MNIDYELKWGQDKTKRVYSILGEAIRLREQYPVKIDTFTDYRSVGIDIISEDPNVLKNVLNGLIEKQGVPEFIRNGSDWKLADELFSAKGYKLTRFAHFLKGFIVGKNVVPRKAKASKIAISINA